MKDDKQSKSDNKSDEIKNEKTPKKKKVHPWRVKQSLRGKW